MYTNWLPAGAFPVFGPARFEATVKPRSQAVEKLIRAQATVNRPAEMEESTVYDKLIAEVI